MEPLRSANSTVTCLRSPSRAAFEVRIRSARCLGVYESGAVNLDHTAPRRGAAHWPQNLLSGGLAAPQLGQVELSGAAHCPQNFIPAKLSCWHREHFMPSPRDAGPSGREGAASLARGPPPSLPGHHGTAAVTRDSAWSELVFQRVVNGMPCRRRSVLQRKSSGMPCD